MEIIHYDKIPINNLYDELELIYDFYEHTVFDRNNIDGKSKDFINYVLKMDNYKSILCYEESRLIGFINYTIYDNSIMISEVQIRKDLRNKGILKSLLKELLNQEKVDNFYGTINDKNELSKLVFTHIGFDKIENNKYGITYKKMNEYLNDKENIL